MKNLIFISLTILFLSACGKNPPHETAQVQRITPLNLSDYQITDIAGSNLKRAVKLRPNGSIIEEGTLLDGKRQGAWVLFNEEKPSPKRVANYVEDRLEGVFMEFNSQGQADFVSHYRENVLDGSFARFKLGRKSEEGNFKMGVHHGTFCNYFSGMDLLEHEVEYAGGKMHGMNRYYNRQGKVVMEYKYERGEKISGGIVEVQAGAALPQNAH